MVRRSDNSDEVALARERAEAANKRAETAEKELMAAHRRLAAANAELEVQSKDRAAYGRAWKLAEQENDGLREQLDTLREQLAAKDQELDAWRAKLGHIVWHDDLEAAEAAVPSTKAADLVEIADTAIAKGNHKAGEIKGQYVFVKNPQDILVRWDERSQRWRDAQGRFRSPPEQANDVK